MKQFLFNVFLFLIPVACVFLFPLYVFMISGEFLPMSVVVKEQMEHSQNPLYLSGLTSATDRPYKLLGTLAHDPKVVTFGTSRTLTIRSTFFKDPSLFYNAGYNGGTTLKTSDLLEYIKNIPLDAKLHTILFDVSGFLSEDTIGESVLGDNIYDRFHYFLTTGWRSIYRDYFSGKFSLKSILTNTLKGNKGLTAVISNAGYRKDGSLDRGSIETRLSMKNKVPADILHTVANIIPGSGGFIEYSKSIPDENLEEIAQFLALCYAKSIYVIGYLSPVALPLDQKMRSLDDGYGNSYRTAPEILLPIFQKYSYSFYDLRTITKIGSSDSELYDAHHPTERSTIKLLLYLANKEPELRSYIHISELKKQINKELF